MEPRKPAALVSVSTPLEEADVPELVRIPRPTRNSIRDLSDKSCAVTEVGAREKSATARARAYEVAHILPE
jgi:hypothetical protein